MNPNFVDPSESQAYWLSSFLVQEGLISPGHMTVAIYDKQHTGLPVEDILILHGWIDRPTLERAMLKRCRKQLKQLLHKSPRHEMTLCLQPD